MLWSRRLKSGSRAPQNVHQRLIRREWNHFYKQNPNPSEEQLLQKATEIDTKYGSRFRPPIGGK